MLTKMGNNIEPAVDVCGVVQIESPSKTIWFIDYKLIEAAQR